MKARSGCPRKAPVPLPGAAVAAPAPAPTARASPALSSPRAEMRRRTALTTAVGVRLPVAYPVRRAPRSRLMSSDAPVIANLPSCARGRAGKRRSHPLSRRTPKILDESRSGEASVQRRNHDRKVDWRRGWVMDFARPDDLGWIPCQLLRGRRREPAAERRKPMARGRIRSFITRRMTGCGCRI